MGSYSISIKLGSSVISIYIKVHRALLNCYNTTRLGEMFFEDRRIILVVTSKYSNKQPVSLVFIYSLPMA